MKHFNYGIFAISFLALSACTGAEGTPEAKPGRPLGYEKYVVNYMLNYRKTSASLPSGAEGATDNLLFLQQEIEAESKLIAPTNPERTNYEFKGWYEESDCLTAWDFGNNVVENNLFLYAKWGITSTEEYIEPEYVYPEKIITSQDFVLEGVLNMPVSNGQVELSTGAINRLKSSPSDVKFAINYSRKQDVTISSATFDTTTMKITVVLSTSASFEVTVVDKTPLLSLATINSTFESKATNYETRDAEVGNYHIALAGSSSMEYWTTSTEDMDPVVTFNHGIGGTTVEQWTEKLNERLVYPYSPKALVYYVGVNNIINSTDTGKICGDKLVALFNETHEHLPNTRVFYVLINKLPGYASYQKEFDEANNIAIDYCASRDWISCIDAGTCLLKPNGEPNAAYFRTDGLHMSQYGYVLWGAEVRNALINWLG